MDISDDSGDSCSSGSEYEEIWEGEGLAHSLFDDFTSPFASQVYKHMASRYGFDYKALGKGTLHRIALITYIEREKAKGVDALECYMNARSNPSIVLDRLEEYINPPFENEKLLWDFMESSDEEGDECLIRRHIHQEQVTKTAKLAARSLNKDDAYFSSYKGLGIHREMVLDKVRTGAYESFVKLNSHLFKDKVVLDVGSGSGILSLFAAKAGAKLVVGIDNCENMVNMAAEHARINGLMNAVFLHSKVEEADLHYVNGVVRLGRDLAQGGIPEPFKCDILISEWMGYGLLYENMLSSVLFARDKYLTGDGFMVPSKIVLGLFGLDMYDSLISKINVWEEPVYGLLLPGLKYEGSELLKEPEVEVVDKSTLISEANGICLLNLRTLPCSKLSVSQPFEVKLRRGMKCSSLALYFDCIFEPPSEMAIDVPPVEGLTSMVFGGLQSYKDMLPSMDTSKTFCTSPDYECANSHGEVTVVMSTRPDEMPTHWKQVILHLMDHKSSPVQLEDVVRGRISLHQNGANNRCLDILVHLENEGAQRDSYYKLV